MPQSKPPLTLEEICIQSVAKNMHSFWCVNAQDFFSQEFVKFDFAIGPFEYLPPNSLHKIITHLIKTKRISKLCLQVLIVSQMMNIDLSGCKKYVTNDVIDLIINRCNKISVLNINGCSKITKDRIIKLIEAFGGTLETLCLNNCKCVDDSVMKAIGINCQRVHHLEISDLKNVTMKGVNYLTFCSKGLTTLTRTLVVLEFHHSLKRYAELATMLIFDNFTNLRMFESNSLMDTIQKWPDASENQQLKLMFSKQQPLALCLYDMYDQPDMAEKMFSCLPHLSFLSILDANHENEEILSRVLSCAKFSYLTSLSINWGFTLKSFLNISSLFPNLTELSIILTRQVNNFHTDSAVSIESPLKNLTYIELSIEYIPTHETIFPALKKLIAHAKLETLIILCVNTDLNSLVQWGLFHSYFKNLKRAEFTHSHLELTTIWDLIIQQSNLKELGISAAKDMNMNDYDRLNKTIKENNLDLIFNNYDFSDCPVIRHNHQMQRI